MDQQPATIAGRYAVFKGILTGVHTPEMDQGVGSGKFAQEGKEVAHKLVVIAHEPA